MRCWRGGTRTHGGRCTDLPGRDQRGRVGHDRRASTPEPHQPEAEEAPGDVPHRERRPAPGAGDLGAPGTRPVAGVAHGDARTGQAGLRRHLGREGECALLQPQLAEQIGAHGAERAVVAESQTEEQPQVERQPVVAEPLVERHATAREAAHGAAPRADHEIRDAGEHGLDEEARLGRVVGAVGLEEDDGAGARGRSSAGARQAGVAVAAARLTEQRRAGGADELRAAVAGAVVHEERAVQQPELAEFREQRRQSLGLVEHGHDDAVVWRR